MGAVCELGPRIAKAELWCYSTMRASGSEGRAFKMPSLHGLCAAIAAQHASKPVKGKYFKLVH